VDRVPGAAPAALEQHDIAVDIGGTSWLVGRWNGELQILGHGLVSARPAGTVTEIAAALALAGANADQGGPAGPVGTAAPRTAGCSFAGAVDRSGRVEAWPSRPSWVGFPLRTALAAALRGTADRPGAPGQPGVPSRPGAPGQPSAPNQAGAPNQASAPNQPGASGQPGVPNRPGASGRHGPAEPAVSIEDDGYCAALGESRLGVARGLADHLTLTLGTGIGGAWTVAGQVRRPVAAGARTIGHLRALDQHRVCRCGAAGCLQTVLADLPGAAAGGDPPGWAEGGWAAGGWAAGRRFVEVVADLAQATGVATVVLTGGLTGLRWLAGYLRDGFGAEGVTCLIPRRGDRSSLLGATIRSA